MVVGLVQDNSIGREMQAGDQDGVVIVSRTNEKEVVNRAMEKVREGFDTVGLCGGHLVWHQRRTGLSGGIEPRVTTDGLNHFVKLLKKTGSIRFL